MAQVKPIDCGFDQPRFILTKKAINGNGGFWFLTMTEALVQEMIHYILIYTTDASNSLLKTQ